MGKETTQRSPHDCARVSTGYCILLYLCDAADGESSKVNSQKRFIDACSQKVHKVGEMSKCSATTNQENRMWILRERFRDAWEALIGDLNRPIIAPCFGSAAMTVHNSQNNYIKVRIPDPAKPDPGAEPHGNLDRFDPPRFQFATPHLPSRGAQLHLRHPLRLDNVKFGVSSTTIATIHHRVYACAQPPRMKSFLQTHPTSRPLSPLHNASSVTPYRFHRPPTPPPQLHSA